MSIIWPNRVTENPTPIQIASRAVHWACAAAGAYFVYLSFAYMLRHQADLHWTELSKLIGLALAFWLGGRGLRFVLGNE